MRIVITGGAGFIGTNIAAAWAGRGADIHVLDNLSRVGAEANLLWLIDNFPGRIAHQIADACDAEAVSRAVKGADLVYHFASQVAVTASLVDPMSDFRANAESTVVSLEAVRRNAPHAPFFYTSTNKVYGSMIGVKLREEETRFVAPDHPDGFDERTPLDFHSPYGCSKGAGDLYVHDYARIFGLRTVVFRMSCIYGPHQWGTEGQGWVMHFARSIQEDRPLTIYGNGKQVRDVLFISDLVDAFVMAYEHIGDAAGGVFNIGGGPGCRVSLLELIPMIEKQTGRRARIEMKPPRPGDQLYYCSDTARARKTFGWNPTIAPHEGLRRVIQWQETEARNQTGGKVR